MEAPITTGRLSLEVLDPAAIRALLAGDGAAAADRLDARLPAEFAGERVHWLRRHLFLLERYPGRAGWCARLAVRPGSREVVGSCGFHGPPEAAGRAEIGYSIFEPFRGRGYATEAAAGLVAWAFGQGEPEVYASVSPGNAPSLAVVRRLGFGQVGEQQDPEDGLELVFTVRPQTFRPPPAPLSPPV